MLEGVTPHTRQGKYELPHIPKQNDIEVKPHRYIYGQKAPWTKQQHAYRLARSAEVRRVDKTRKGLEDLRSESLGRQVV